MGSEYGYTFKQEFDKEYQKLIQDFQEKENEIINQYNDMNEKIEQKIKELKSVKAKKNEFEYNSKYLK